MNTKQWFMPSVALALSAASGWAWADQSLQLAPGGAQTVHLEGSAATVVLADPEVADVTTISDTKLVVTAKRPGRTALLIFDAQGAELLQREIMVGHPEPARRVRLYKGLGNLVEEFRCSPTECVGPVGQVSAPGREDLSAPVRKDASTKQPDPQERESR